MVSFTKMTKYAQFSKCMKELMSYLREHPVLGKLPTVQRSAVEVGLFADINPVKLFEMYQTLIYRPLGQKIADCDDSFVSDMGNIEIFAWIPQVWEAEKDDVTRAHIYYHLQKLGRLSAI